MLAAQVLVTTIAASASSAVAKVKAGEGGRVWKIVLKSSSGL